MKKQYTEEFKNKVVNDYKRSVYGGMDNLAKHYKLPKSTIKNWIHKDRSQGNQINDIEHKRGSRKNTEVDYKELYEILKKYQTFVKAQRVRR